MIALRDGAGCGCSPLFLCRLTIIFTGVILNHMEQESEIPSGLFRSPGKVVRNDRYVVYRMLNRRITFKDPEKGNKVVGFVDEVYRDIFSGEIKLLVLGRQYRFKEPVLVRDNDNEVVFVYGDVGRQNVSDKKMFAEMRKEQFRESASETMHRMTPKRIREVRFQIGDKKPSRKKPFLMRGITADVSMTDI